MNTLKTVATDGRSFRTFLLMQQFAAREIGERIAQARREHGAMTQEQLAELLDVSTRAVQDYEGGRRIPWKHFKRLEQIFQRSLEWFLHGETEEEPALLERLESVDERLAVIEEVLSLLVPADQVDALAAARAAAAAAREAVEDLQDGEEIPRRARGSA
jgi:transcriptional regulator with XRE-family HTH domain